MGIADELERLAELYRRGELDEGEFLVAKRQLLPGADPTPPKIAEALLPTSAPVSAPEPPPVSGSHLPGPITRPRDRYGAKLATNNAAPDVAPQQSVPYRPGGLRQLSQWVAGSFWLYYAWAFVVLALTGTAWTRDAELGRSGTDTALEASIAADANLFAAVPLVILAMVPIFLLFVSWLWRLHGQIAAVDRSRLTWGRGWAVGGWFLPVGFLFIPYLVVRQLVMVTFPRERATARWWWTAFLTMGILGQLWVLAADAEMYRLAYSIIVFQVASGCTAAALAARLVRTLTDAQTRSDVPSSDPHGRGSSMP